MCGGVCDIADSPCQFSLRLLQVSLWYLPPSRVPQSCWYTKSRLLSLLSLNDDDDDDDDDDGGDDDDDD